MPIAQNKLFLTTAICLSVFTHNAFSANIFVVDQGAMLSTNNQNLTQDLSLDYGTSYQPSKEIKLPNSTTKVKLQQYFHDVPVFGMSLVVSKNKAGKYSEAKGLAANNFNNNSQLTTPSISKEEAISIAMNAQTNSAYSVGVKKEVDDPQVKLWVYFDSNNKEHLVYIINYLQIKDQKITRPFSIVDAHNKVVLKQWNGLTTQKMGTGPGGNLKTGRYEYGTDKPFLDIKKIGDKCYMESKHVKTVNMAGRFTKPKPDDEAYNFPCVNKYRNTYKETNGAFSPVNDAHYFGDVIFGMYGYWLNLQPLPFQLVMNVHYNMYPGPENAWWDGKTMNFGDGGDDLFYPFVGLDVAAHEISHGFTEMNSNLEYSGESGGMNEAFSDMAGEAAKYYSQGYNDWLLGIDITKSYGPLRYMKNPRLDGCSVSNYEDYVNFDSSEKPQCSSWNDFGKLNVHYISGIYNRAFYNLATTEGWDTPKAFVTFAIANILYWQPNSTMKSGACGVINAARDMHYNSEAVISAFSNVGLACNSDESSKS
ncbi:peptidase M4 family protein [Parashewanella spongiae]|uniref:Neutral metalloproteinase n=1 Tax=Parashewanella spongiae TaxID=342950 RepID=A0A3A6UJU0_9GAMM|nr:M4 family metallopeptidase [Parashewanella spongiae]MCL1076717.1 M4 family metallopeptidase [Parashewanella spongiae]RJY19461.1 peptidase M4 family protein [Parashewanella spongiae]